MCINSPLLQIIAGLLALIGLITTVVFLDKYAVGYIRDFIDSFRK